MKNKDAFYKTFLIHPKFGVKAMTNSLEEKEIVDEVAAGLDGKKVDYSALYERTRKTFTSADQYWLLTLTEILEWKTIGREVNHDLIKKIPLTVLAHCGPYATQEQLDKRQALKQEIQEVCA